MVKKRRDYKLQVESYGVFGVATILMVYVRVLCGVRYVSMGVRQEEDIIQPMEDDIKWCSSPSLHVQIQVEHHQRDLILEACRPLW